jgi:hypothetical protein
LINTGVLEDQGNKVPLPARIYVDDALTLATSKENMEQILVALIEAFFAIMGAPNTSVCPCSLAMDKWGKLHVAPIQSMLGLVIDTNRMTISVPDNNIQSVCLLIDSTWHTHRQQFTVKEAQELTGKLGHLAKGANWVFHLLTHLYASIAYALSENIRFLADSSPEFQTLIKSLHSDYFFLQCQGPNPLHLFHHQTVCKIGTSIQVSVQHYQVNAPGDRVLPQKNTC